KNGRGKNYSPGGNYTANVSATLYARWGSRQVGKLPTAVKKGYKFAGWYTSPYGGTRIKATTRIRSSKTLYPRWKVTSWRQLESWHGYKDNTYEFLTYRSPKKGIASLSITFDKRTRTQSGKDFIIIKNKKGKTVGRYSGSRLAGKTIKVDGNAVHIGIKSNGSVSAWGYKVTRVRTSRIRYPVTYSANGGKNAPKTQYKVYGKTLRLSKTKPTKSYSLTFKPNGGTVSTGSKSIKAAFRGWNTKPGGSGKNYSRGGTYKRNAKLKLYAKWSGVYAGTLPVPTRAGYAFEGWYTSGGVRVTSSTAIRANYVLTARWRIKSVAGLNSAHPYANHTDETKTFTSSEPGVTAYEVTFDGRTETEHGYDKIYVNGKSYTGTELAGATKHADGKSLSIRLQTDFSNVKWGYCVTMLGIIKTEQIGLESSHHYGANCNESTSFTARDSNVKSLDITFDNRTKTEAICDIITIKTKDGTIVGRYSGDELAGRTIHIPSNNVTISLISNGSSEDWGYKVEKIKINKYSN
ncbi:MAG: InlB B-repeat-containing protein, partial [Prevotellaceae bacterium]|nr:InlB B-repeat-containing protein [Prevotellaceae bacterium]